MVARIIKAIFGKRKRIDADALADLIGELRGFTARELRGGFVGQDEIVENAVEMFGDQCDADTLRPHARRLLAEQVELLRIEQRSWPAVTDYERLDAAFSALEARGIVCRQNFTCCGTCGSAEIWDEIEAARQAGASPRGYAFFHMQDTESAVEDGGLHMNYGAIDEGEPSALVIADEVVGEIAKAGLQVEWDGSWEKRIHVALDWKRRIPL